ncbi:MAG TPA: hypothetical protein VK824_11025 [Planctomycetota bacterium]|nr:hypothetical protein [Planctomycetota bacterium]
MRRRALPFALIVLGLLTSGCAWSNRANRPVWNAFEAHLVPEEDTAFYASLPLTVPAGLLSILADTFVVHPAQVADDAWEDAGRPWRKLDWQHEYHTELALIPFRMLGSPLIFLGSFLGRSLFDMRPSADAPSPEAVEEEARALLERMAARDDGDEVLAALQRLDWPAWSPALEVAWEHALTRGAAATRQSLLALARWKQLPPWRADPWRGLRDPSAVVRHDALVSLDASVRPPPELVEALRNDPEEAVRDQARRLWPAPE